jgi:2-polyprenyl-6-methoxyphenol hydroxylase-like FAD-dependent oxidoreductase
MGDFDDNTGWAPEAHLFFTRLGPVESFPLPLGRRRWIVRTRPGHPVDAAYLRSEVARIAGHDLADARLHWSSVFRIGQIMAMSYGRDRVALCGDACHAISPIGGQGMNTGFADAYELARIIPEILRGSITPHHGWALYNRRRRAAGRVAARRGWGWVWLGTRRGVVLSAVRSGLVTSVLASPVRQRLAVDFTMLNLPGTAGLLRASHLPAAGARITGVCET